MTDRIRFALAAGIIAGLLLFLCGIARTPFEPATARIPGSMEEPSWIVKWKDRIDPQFIKESEIVAQYPEERIVVARPASPQRLHAWLARWSQTEQIEYLQANGRVAIAYTPNDPMVEKQNYLRQIRAVEAWNYSTGNESIVIAVVDTGVDLSHPELTPNLVPGVNLLDPEKPPQDDNGHGTNVAGVIAAVGNNDKGVAGLLWRAKVMPIKALGADGTGSEAKLGEGIRYAVDHGAKIVVLSLGLNKYTPYMSEIVNYAEQRGVLLVAASGNEGKDVKYPAAYPTVLAVGGVDADNRADKRSNFGPELDLVAPMTVYTTSLGSGYEYKDGTSMAAPQAAAVAALVLSKYPELKPYQIRNLLRQTAEDLDVAGWDPHTGYGLLRADFALSRGYEKDMYEPNESPEEAKTITLGKMMTAEIAGREDADWYVIDAPYDGTVSIRLEIAEGAGTLRLEHYVDNRPARAVDSDSAVRGVELPVKKGRSFIKIQSDGSATGAGFVYHIHSQFRIYSDPFEDNDRQYMAYTLPLRSQTLKGTFSKNGDEDWYMLPVARPGRLRIGVTADTARMDLVLVIQKKGEQPTTIDRNGDARPETTPVMDVGPGQYYIRVSNVKDYAYPVTGEYTLTIDYVETHADPYEPNDKPYQATAIRFDADYSGVLEARDDEDWFQFRLEEDSPVQIRVRGVSNRQSVFVKLLDRELNELNNAAAGENSDLVFDMELKAGSYFIRLIADGTLIQGNYRLLVHADRMTADFGDIAGHWAAAAVGQLRRNGIIEGYASNEFRPDRPITRAEAVMLLARAFPSAASANIRFPDVGADHWAFDAIAKAAAEGLVEGYPDGRFHPNRQLTRKEMAALLARVLGLNGAAEAAGEEAPFADVGADDWSAGLLRQMKAEGWIEGYADGTFAPDRAATRAEFAYLLNRVLNREKSGEAST